MANFTAQAVVNLFAAMKTQAEQSGLFQRVIGHEPRSAPGAGYSYCLWLGPVQPVGRVSGLGQTAGRVIINARVLTPLIEKSEDQIETQMLRTILQLIGFYSGSITVGGTVMEIDLLGAYGVPLEAGNVGYMEIGGSHFRVAELTIPVIIDALWTQVN